MDLVFQGSNGVILDERNIPDALYNANVAEIKAWANATGVAYYVTTDNPDPTTGTLINLTQIQTWIAQVKTESGGASATLPSGGSSAPSSSWGAIAAVAALVVGGGLAAWWATTRARENPIEERGAPKDQKRCRPGQHARGCRPGRPLCAARRKVCNCGSFWFPHRPGSGACKYQVPHALYKLKSFRREMGIPDPE